MKLHRQYGSCRPTRRASSQSGSAVLIAVILLGLISVMIVSNTRTLDYLNANLKLIEKRQLSHYSAPDAGKTQPPK